MCVNTNNSAMPFVNLFVYLVTVVSSGNSALIPIQSDGTSEPTSATTDLANQAVPLASGKKKTSMLLKNIPKPGRTSSLIRAFFPCTDT